jgi:hypothetical protein
MGHNMTSRIGDAQRPPRTQCKICDCSIFIGDDTVWVISPRPGLAHRICAEEVKEGPPREP